jgi:hypothetical protein
MRLHYLSVTVWSSWDSGASWVPWLQVEPKLETPYSLHTAYSALLQLSDTTAMVVWERGPMWSRCTPAYPNCYKPAGEYQSLRSRIIAIPQPVQN